MSPSSIPMSAPENAFHDLARIFVTRNNRILEIEILPPVLGPFLQDECSIGITKKYLVQAFVTARRIFLDNYTSTFDHGNADVLCNSEKTLDGLSVSTEIILLFDCEHLTACSWRKKRLASQIQRCNIDQSNSARETLHALDEELSLMTSFLCSPLHRHTKSPTLWQHRLWVLGQMTQLRNSCLGITNARIEHCGSQHPHDNSMQEPAFELLKAELNIVLRAGELHPKNYYAFSYMRELHRILSDTSGDASKPLALSIVDSTVKWCLAHPTDISGWMFSLHLLEAAQDRTLQENTINRVVRFAVDVGWEGESLWTFVDLATRSLDLAVFVKDVLQPRSGIVPSNTLELDGRPEKEMTVSRNAWKIWLAMARVNWTGGNEIDDLRV